MKKLYSTLLVLSFCTYAGAQSLSNYDLELGYSASAQSPNSIQSLRLVSDGNFALHLDMYAQDAYFPSGFPGGPNELGGVYAAFTHDMLSNMVSGFSYEMACGFIIDNQDKITQMQFANPEMGFKHSIRYALPIEAFDAKIEANYMFTSATHLNGLFIGLSSKWSIF